MTPEAADVLKKAADAPLCTCAVVGILANGGGLYIDWSGQTIHSLITHLEAAKLEALQKFIDATHQAQSTPQGNA